MEGQKGAPLALDTLMIILGNPLLDDEKRMETLREIVQRWKYAQMDSAYYYLSIYHNIATKTKNKKHLAKVAGDESQLYLDEGRFLEASKSAQNRIDIGLEIENYTHIAGGYSDLGNVYQKMGNLDSALVAYQSGLKYARLGMLKSPEQKGVTEARSLINISETYKLKGNYVEALIQAQAAIDLCLKNNFTGFYASTYNLLGEIYVEVKDYERAIVEFKKAIEVAKKLNNQNRLSIAYELLAQCQIVQQNYVAAEQNLRLSIDVAKTSKLQKIEGRALWKLAELYHLQNLNSKALLFVKQSEQLLLDNNDNIELISALRMKGAIYIQLNNHEQAKQACLSAQRLNQETGKKAAEIEICYCLYQAYKGLKELGIAMNYLESHNRLKDSLMNFSISRKITQIEDQKIYDAKVLLDSLDAVNTLTKVEIIHQQKSATQQRLLTISIAIGLLVLVSLVFVITLYVLNKKKQAELQLKSDLIQDQKTKIETSLDEKELLLKEIHHRVKNNLQIISSLLDLQSNSIVDNAASNALLEGKSRVKSMALIHQKLYQTDNLAVVNMKDYVQELSTYLNGLYGKGKKINILLDIDNINLDVDTAIPLGLILNELISNAFKYAFDDISNPQISIAICSTNVGEYELVFKDNGRGMDSKFEIKDATSLGLKLVKRLVQQLFGKIKLENNNGLLFMITFKDTKLRKEVD